MTKGNGLPCVRCGTSDWFSGGNCKVCAVKTRRQWAQDNQDKVKMARNRWKIENPDKRAEYQRRYRKSSPGRDAAYSATYKKSNSVKINAINNIRRTRKTEAGGSYTREEFNALCAHYGNKCLRCNRTGVKLTFDHVVPVSKGGTSDISNGQPLCGSCNSAKGDKHIDYRPDAGPLRWLQAKLFG